MQGFIPSEPAKVESAILPYPWFWCGEATLDGTIAPWLNAPLGSMYVFVEAGSVAIRFKTANNSATADWVTVTAV